MILIEPKLTLLIFSDANARFTVDTKKELGKFR